MIEQLLDVFKTAIAILPFVLLCFQSSKVNLPSTERSKQFAMPIIALIYVLPMMLFMDSINDKLIDLINSVPKWISLLADIPWVPEPVANVLSSASNVVDMILKKLNLNFWIFFISNTLMITVYLTLKRICMAFIRKTVNTDGELHEKVAEKFYEYFPEKNSWCLMENYVQVRSTFKVFYYSAVILSALLMLVSRYFYYEGLFRTVFYPVFGILLLGELYFYLDGTTRREYTGDILGEDEEAYKTVNYSLLRKFLRSIFGDKLLTENTSINNALAYDVTTDDIIYELEKSEDQKVVCFASYISTLHKTGFAIDHNYLKSSLDMLNGKSILFNNPFYNDLIPYAFYPMNRALLSHRKVLVVLGRHSVENDIAQWLEKGISAVTNIPFMWNIGVLNSEEQDVDIGIVTRSDVLNIELHNANSAFLEKVGFVVILEPSKLISTAQIGLNLLAKKCKADEDKEIVYCLCDKNCDGLIDAMSHVLMTSITEVSATKKHLGTSSYMCWETDEEYLHHRLVPNISRYLGIGTELSFAALKNQVSKTKWFGGEAFPVTDIRWIGKQYYYDLTKYANLPTNQEVLDECFITTPNFWSAEAEPNNYLTVEDESSNMFEILREFSTRTTEQGFINVISSEYLLKDYMADNASIFEADAKAIPCIVADYTRSNRNTVLRLILMMSTFPINSEILEKELSLLGIGVFDPIKQLWYELFNCYSRVTESEKLPEDYKEAVRAAYSLTLRIGDEEWTSDLIEEKETFNLKTGRLETTYSITDSRFLKICVSELRSAGYVAEDEKGQRYYLGSELGGHIYQKYLPGQFFTFGGKYYEMQYLTADGQVLVRRAADHVSGRPAYRQLREYTVCGIKPSEKIGAQQDISGMKVIKEFADITVTTPGYYRMEKYNDFASAKKISFEGERNGIPKRIYCNKEILRIELPDINGKLSDNVRYTVTVLFNEIFKTIFAENQAYICAVTDDSFLGDESVRPLTFSIKGEGCELGKNAIYIIEDSQLDLGLTVAVERNLQRIFNIIYDYLDWHAVTLEESLNPSPEPQPPIIFTDPDQDNGKKKGLKGVFAAIGAFFKKIFGKIGSIFKKKPKKPVEEEPTDTPEDIPDDTTSGEDNNGTQESRGNISVGREWEQNPKNDSSNDGDSTSRSGMFAERKPYHQRYYLLFGGESELPCIDTNATLEYLAEMGMNRNSLKQAREGKRIAEFIEATFQPGKPDARYCDFCGTEIFGVEYETLADGRDRCLRCGKTAIKTGEEFRKIFEDVKRNMESFFGIKINVGIKVEMVNSRTLHKRLGKAFLPTPNTDGRVLGVAISDKNGFSLLVENGSPRMASMLTMAHELTHIWQYINWDDKAIRKKYGRKMHLEIYEGMAKWVEIQYAYLINEPATAKREEIITFYRDDEYGRGFLRYRANYPFSTGTVITKPTPFMNTDTPLDPQYCGPFTVVIPTTGINPGDIENTHKPTPTPKPPVNPIMGTKERDPGRLNRYAYNLLSRDEQTVYGLMLTAINSFEHEIPALPVSVTDEQAKKISAYVQIDHPEIFWFQSGTTYFFDNSTHVVSKLQLTYCVTPEEAKARQKKIEASIKPFLSSINDSMSDYEVTLRIYENIIKLVDYDTIGLERQEKKKLTSDVPDDLRSIYGVFVNKKAVCVGYSKALQYLLNLFGIECLYVTSATHAWNIVKLEGDYYHMDVTWGDGTDTKKDKNQSDSINYDCFCLTTEEIRRLDSHEPESLLPVPKCTATKCNYHRRHGLYFEEYSLDRVKHILSESVKHGRFEISLKFASSALYKEACKKLVDKGEFHDAIQFAGSDSGIKLDSAYRYSERAEKQILVFFVAKG